MLIAGLCFFHIPDIVDGTQNMVIDICWYMPVAGLAIGNAVPFKIMITIYRVTDFHSNYVLVIFQALLSYI